MPFKCNVNPRLPHPCIQYMFMKHRVNMSFVLKAGAQQSMRPALLLKPSDDLFPLLKPTSSPIYSFPSQLFSAPDKPAAVLTILIPSTKLHIYLHGLFPPNSSISNEHAKIVSISFSYS